MRSPFISGRHGIAEDERYDEQDFQRETKNKINSDSHLPFDQSHTTTTAQV